MRLQLLEAVAIEQAADRVLACLQHLEVAQRAVQPAAQQSAGHGGLAAVDHRLQGVVTAAGQVDVQLQVAAAGAVEDDRVVQAFVAQAAQVRQGGALGFLGVDQQATGGADGQGQLVAAKALEVLGRELLAQGLARRVAVEVPWRTPTGARAFLGRQVARPVVGDQQLDRVQALELGQQVFPALDLLHAEVATGDVQYGQAEQALVTEQRGNQVVATLVEQGLVADRTRGDDAHHLAFHRALAGGGVANLLADHHRFAEFDQLGQVAFQRMEWNPAHGDGLAGRLSARGQGDVQQFCGFFRIFVEDLVEVAHAVEHQLVRVLVLQLPVLLHHRGVCGEIGNCFIHQGLRK
ncbi:hypothetical protein D3C78_979100 [compost metagenome]